MLACLPVCLLACTCGCCNQRIPLRLFVLPSVFTPLSTYQISPTLFLSCLLAPDRLCETQSEAEHRPSCSRGGLVVRPSARSLECVGERQRRSVDPDSRFHLGCGQGARGRRAGFARSLSVSRAPSITTEEQGSNAASQMADEHSESHSSRDSSPTPTPTPHRRHHQNHQRSPSPSPKPRRPSTATTSSHHSDVDLDPDSPTTTATAAAASAASAAANAEQFSASNTWEPPQVVAPAPTPSITFQDPPTPAGSGLYAREPLPARAKSYPAASYSSSANNNSSHAKLTENPWATSATTGGSGVGRVLQQGSDASVDSLPGASSSAAGSNGSGSRSNKKVRRGRRPRGRPRTRYFSTESGGPGEEEALLGNDGVEGWEEEDEEEEEEDDGQPLLMTRRRRNVPAPLLAVVLVVLLLIVVLVVFVVDRSA
ncbi:hypothetical protein JOL62DRAFT_310594 [Phyllosticta paracitricarpa]|uniref:Uncharacterized protein n=1 Tax=Phyllosticta paracitricarpa TaxID=2016321 RepID=A0ABR1MXQ0_9PEZI